MMMITNHTTQHLAFPTIQLNGEVNAFQRSFVGEIRRLDEMERRCRLFHTQITESSPPIGLTPLSAIPPFTSVGPRAAQAFDELDDKLTEHETRLNQINSSFEVLGRRQRELEEARCVLRETAGFFDQNNNNGNGGRGRGGVEIRSSFDDNGDGSAPLLENAAEYGTLPGESGFNGVDLE
jgi:V-type H+-transporting ATPase subunit a